MPTGVAPNISCMRRLRSLCSDSTVVEEEEEAEEEVERVELGLRHPARRVQETGTEGADRKKRRIDRREQDQGDEEVHPRPHHEVPDLAARDDAGALPEAERAGRHPEVGEGGRRRHARSQPGIGGGVGALGDGRSGVGGLAAPQTAQEVELHPANQHPAGVAAHRGRYGGESQQRDDHPADDEPRVGPQRLRVVELHAPVDGEVGLIEPPETGGVDEHEQPVDVRREPVRRPCGQEGEGDEDRRHGEGEDDDRTARPGAEEKGGAAEEQNLRRPEEERREEVVPGMEGTDHLRAARPLHDVREKAQDDEEDQPRGRERAHCPEELAPRVLARREACGVEDLRHLQFEVADDDHPARDGQEPGRDCEHRDALDHALVVDRRDVGPLGAGDGAARGHGDAPLDGHEREDHEQHPLRRTSERRAEFPPRDLPPPRERVHAAPSSAASGRAPFSWREEEVGVLQRGIGRFEPFRGRARGEVDADLVAALDEDRLRDPVVVVDRGQILLGDGALVDRAREAAPGLGRGRVRDEAAAGHDRDAGTEHRDVIHDVRGEKDGPVLGEFREQAVEAEPLLRVEAGGRLVHDQDPGVARQRLRDPEPLPHTARVALNLSLGGVGEIHAVEQFRREPLHPLRRLHPFEDEQETQHRLAREVGIEAEVLRQVTQLPPDAAGVGDDVLAVEVDGAGGRLEQPGHDAHERGLPPPRWARGARNIPCPTSSDTPWRAATGPG